MHGKSKKVQETEAYVDACIEKYGFPPTYKQIQAEFNLASGPAYARCAKFRDKMKKTYSSKITDVRMKFSVPVEKFEKFAELLKQIQDLLKYDKK